MYSIVLMAALGSSMETPDFGRRGCHGCRGGCYGCSGGCYGGYGGCHGCRGGRRARRHGCHGCYGGYGGCYGGCSGGYGGSYGGCYGGGSAGCYGGGYGGCYGGCSGGYGGISTGGNYGSAGVAPRTYVKRRADAPATVVVKLPPRARLSINGRATNTRSSRRVFRSPTLRSGKVYYYTMKASIKRNGRTLTAKKRVKVRAGRRTTVSFKFNPTSVAHRR